MLIKKTAIILCGGKSSKGYKNKAFLRIGEKNFLDIIIEKISNFDEIIISCSNKKIFSNYSGISKIVEDDIQVIGPISGMYKSLNESRNSKVLMLSSDMPLVREEYIKKLGIYEFDEDALITFTNGSSQPLCGVYDKKVNNIIRSLIENKNYSVKELLKYISVRYIFPKESTFFRDVNNLEDYIDICSKSMQKKEIRKNSCFIVR